MANPLASTILGYAFGLLKVDSTTVSTPGLQTTQMLAVLSDANSEWARTFKRSGGEPPTLLEREKGYDLVADTALAEDVATTDASWDVDSATNLDSSGVIAIWDDNEADLVEYTKSSNTLTGTVDWAHEDGDTVSKLYPLPSNFGTLRTQDDAIEGVRVNGEEYLFTSGTPRAGQFTIYDSGTTKYLFLPRGTTGFALLRYNKSSTTIDEASDTVDVPPEYQYFLVNRLVAHGHRVRAEEDRAVIYDRKADDILLQSQMEKNVRKIIRVRPIRSRFGNYYEPSLEQSSA